ncbi:MAG: dual specificity protein phosphatase family protein [Oligosphaeraceae bacterium]|nr:dual specificity protein phosphatase family protein [Oligosphaeraceae bacterium]
MSLKRFIIPAFFLGLISISARDANWAQPIKLSGVENLYLVEPGLYRSAKPSELGYKALYELGLRQVLSLLSPFEEQKDLTGSGLTLHRIPMLPMLIMDCDIIAGLRLLRARKPEEPILVHCQRGADRTGVLVAAYRIIQQNWTVAAAIEEMRQGGYGHNESYKNISAYLEKMDIEKLRRDSDPRKSEGSSRRLELTQ